MRPRETGGGGRAVEAGWRAQPGARDLKVVSVSGGWSWTGGTAVSVGSTEASHLLARMPR